MTLVRVATLYTNGSVARQASKAEYAFVCKNHTTANCIRNELVAIKSALTYALYLSEPTIYILTDCLSATLTLQKDPILDNIYMIVATLFKIRQLHEQGKIIKLVWIPSHVGIENNERAEKAAKNSLNHTNY